MGRLICLAMAIVAMAIMVTGCGGGGGSMAQSQLTGSSSVNYATDKQISDVTVSVTNNGTTDNGVAVIETDALGGVTIVATDNNGKSAGGWNYKFPINQTARKVSLTRIQFPDGSWETLGPDATAGCKIAPGSTAKIVFSFGVG